MNAADRFFAASRAHDLAAASAELAPDVVMLDPASDKPTIGRQAVAAALAAVERSCDAFCTPIFWSMRRTAGRHCSGSYSRHGSGRRYCGAWTWWSRRGA